MTAPARPRARVVSADTRNEVVPRGRRPAGPTDPPAWGCRNRPAPRARPPGRRRGHDRPASVTNRRYEPGRGQPLPVVAGEDLPQQDRQRPAIEHDVVIGQHNPVLSSGAVRINATRNAGGSARSQTAARSAAHTRWICSSTSTSVASSSTYRHGGTGIGRDDLHRLVELLAESGGQVGMAVDHGVHRIAQPVRVERTGHRDVELHRVHIVARHRERCWRGTAVPAAAESAAGRRRSGSAGAARRSAAGSAGPGRYRTGSARRRRRCTWAQMPARASNHSWLSRLIWPWSSADGAQVQVACSCGPVSVSTVPALSSTVCTSGIGIAVAASVTDKPSWLDPPQVIGQCLGARRRRGVRGS